MDDSPRPSPLPPSEDFRPSPPTPGSPFLLRSPPQLSARPLTPNPDINTATTTPTSRPTTATAAATLSTLRRRLNLAVAKENTPNSINVNSITPSKQTTPLPSSSKPPLQETTQQALEQETPVLGINFMTPSSPKSSPPKQQSQHHQQQQHHPPNQSPPQKNSTLPPPPPTSSSSSSFIQSPPLPSLSSFNPDDFFASPPRRNLFTTPSRPNHNNYNNNTSETGNKGSSTPDLKRRLFSARKESTDENKTRKRKVDHDQNHSNDIEREEQDEGQEDDTENAANAAAVAAVGWLSSVGKKRRRLLQDIDDEIVMNNANVHEVEDDCHGITEDDINALFASGISPNRESSSPISGRKRSIMGQGWVIRTLDVGTAGEYGGLGILEDPMTGIGSVGATTAAVTATILETAAAKPPATAASVAPRNGAAIAPPPFAGKLVPARGGKSANGVFVNAARGHTGPSKCSCKASQCLKLYCPCFASSNVCGEACVCKNCRNLSLTSDAVRRARETVLNRDPRAFAPRIRQSAVQVGHSEELHAKGCNCRKGCEKNYCVCRENGVQCGPRCTCSGPSGCMNGKIDHGGGNVAGMQRRQPHGPARRGRPIRQRNTEAVDIAPLAPNARGLKFPFVLPNSHHPDHYFATAPRVIAAAPTTCSSIQPKQPHLVPLKPHPIPASQEQQRQHQQQKQKQQQQQQVKRTAANPEGVEQKPLPSSPAKTPATGLLNKPPNFLESTPMTGVPIAKSNIGLIQTSNAETRNNFNHTKEKEEKTPNLKPGTWDTMHASAVEPITISPTTGRKRACSMQDDDENKDDKKDQPLAIGEGWSKTLDKLREKQRVDNKLCPRILRIKMGEGRALKKMPTFGSSSSSSSSSRG